MIDRDKHSQQLLERASQSFCDAAVPPGPSSELVASTADLLQSLETPPVRFRRKHASPVWSPFARYSGAAVAVTLMIMAAAWLVVIDRSAPVAFADFQERVSKVSSVQYVETRKANNGEPQQVSRIMILGRHLRRTEVQDADGNVEHVVILDAKNGKCVSLDPNQKRFVLLHSQITIDIESGTQTESKIEPDLTFDFYKHMREIPPEATRRLAERTIDGRKVIGFYSVQKRGSHTWTRTVWVDPQTKFPVRIEVSHRSTDRRAGPSDWVLTDFIFDQDLDRSKFSTDAPAGYTVETGEILGLEVP